MLATAQKSDKFGAEHPAWYADRVLYGGTLLWIASRGINALLFTTGQELVSVYGRQGNVSQPNFGTMEDHTVSVFLLSGRGAGVVHADFLRAEGAASRGDDRVRLTGSLGTMEVRSGCWCMMTHHAAKADITDKFASSFVHRELLATLSGQSTVYHHSGYAENGPHRA